MPIIVKSVDVSALPPAPAIPKSNASYLRLVEKVQQSVIHGPQAIEHVRDCIAGKNTYAKMVRRYADQCLQALEAEMHSLTPTPAQKAPAARKPRAVKAAPALPEKPAPKPRAKKAQPIVEAIVEKPVPQRKPRAKKVATTAPVAKIAAPVRKPAAKKAANAKAVSAAKAVKQSAAH